MVKNTLTKSIPKLQQKNDIHFYMNNNNIEKYT